MNREIKFRGFSKYKPEWWYGNLNYNECLYKGEDSRIWISSFVRESGNINQFMNLCHFAEVYPESVGQYTGLKDKNGKEIYEVDILKCKEATEPEDLGFTVVWNNNGFYAKCNRRVNGEFIITLLDDYFKNKTEVIGNIYENPELLNRI